MTVTSNSLTVEWAPFQVAVHVTDNQLIDAANDIEQNFLLKQKGYVRRELLKGQDNQWIDLVYWTTTEAAAMAAQAATESPVCMNYFSLMQGAEDTEAGISYYQQIRTWN